MRALHLHTRTQRTTLLINTYNTPRAPLRPPTRTHTHTTLALHLRKKLHFRASGLLAL